MVWPDARADYNARRALEGAHSYLLGLDRSVCLRDVVEALRNDVPGIFVGDAVDFLEREFNPEGKEDPDASA
jgi:hypothetical protein